RYSLVVRPTRQAPRDSADLAVALPAGTGAVPLRVRGVIATKRVSGSDLRCPRVPAPQISPLRLLASARFARIAFNHTFTLAPSTTSRRSITRRLHLPLRRVPRLSRQRLHRLHRNPRPEPERLVAARRNHHPHHVGRHHQLQRDRLALRRAAVQGHLDQRTARVDLAAHHVRPRLPLLQVRLDRIAQRFQRLREKEDRVTVLVVHQHSRVAWRAQRTSIRNAAAARQAFARASVTSSPTARVTATRRWPSTRGLPNRRSWVSGSTSALSTPENTGTPCPSASTAHDADGPRERITGIGRPRIARACSANSLRSCPASVTSPVSCGRGDTSLNQTSSPRTKNSIPNTPQPPRSSATARAIACARSSASGDIGCGCQLSR